MFQTQENSNITKNLNNLASYLRRSINGYCPICKEYYKNFAIHTHTMFYMLHREDHALLWYVFNHSRSGSHDTRLKKSKLKQKIASNWIYYLNKFTNACKKDILQV